MKQTFNILMRGCRHFHHERDYVSVAYVSLQDCHQSARVKDFVHAHYFFKRIYILVSVFAAIYSLI